MIAYIVEEIDTDGVPSYEKTGRQIDVVSYKYMARTISDPNNIGQAIILNLRMILFEEIEDGQIIEFENYYYRNIINSYSLTNAYAYEFEKIRI